MAKYEGELLKEMGFDMTKPGYEKTFTNIELDGEDFKVRTIYLGKDPEKKTVVNIHGVFAFSLAASLTLKLLSYRYNIVTFDVACFGQNTRL